MLLKYGTYTHAHHECAIVITRRAQFSPRGHRRFVRETWQIAGWLHGANPAELTGAIAALRTAYAATGVDAGLYLDDGQTPTDHVLLSAQTLGGVRVRALDFPHGTGAEYSTFRSYQITLEADFPEASPTLWDFAEALTFQGTGGPRRLFLETLDGVPQLQLVAAQTTYRAVQRGRAVGSSGYPVLALPLWPGEEHLDRRQVTYVAPERHGPDLVHYIITWQYSFESATPLLGLPTVV